MEGIKPMRLFDEETIKIWVVNIGAVLVTVSEAAGAVISFLGSLAATERGKTICLLSILRTRRMANYCN